MPPRRSHKKSRAGCHRCKTRKIKCDEVHPKCGNCVKHGVACDFEGGRHASDELSPNTTVATPVTTPAVTPNVTLAVPEPPSSQPSPVTVPVTPVVSLTPTSLQQLDRFMELRLLHHFTTSTSKTLFTRPPSTEDVWQRAVPHMAFDGRSYLMDAILSVAALHLRSQHPHDKALARASHAYSASALAEYCATLERGITADNAEALFLTASLIAFQSTASRIFTKDDAETDMGNAPSSSRYVLPMPWFHAFQGVKTIVASSWQWIRNSDTVKAVIDSQPSFQLDLNPLGPQSFFGHLLDGLDDELATEPPHRVSATSQGYSHAVSVLNWAHKNAHAPAALAFPASVSRRFLEVVEEKRPRALAILACFFALLKRLDNVWWLDNVARREVTGIVSMLEPGSSWWRHLEWPVRISVWDGNSIPADTWGAECENPPHGDKGFVETMMSHIELLSKLTSQAQPPKGPPTPADGDFGLAVAPLD
ncbi:hypothetical protein HIM_07142 [Hirsutella minnesotensis 3608]|uniref:Zn(2)-C6 fungal-type domain-containing protein n=1 Tax=Hirsutella minnesotensis 3608 TaxID=1043627 RepID=A0A0F7ZIB7_9HYPO|nr:hypothetical protein HIM_07142 [Hirsutella minnesotensis 3608]